MDKVEQERTLATVRVKLEEDRAREAELLAHPPMKTRARKRKRQGPGKFWARSCAGWYLNSRYVVGSSAYNLRHGR